MRNEPFDRFYRVNQMAQTSWLVSLSGHFTNRMGLANNHFFYHSIFFKVHWM
jgi:hypothetical protein